LAANVVAQGESMEPRTAAAHEPSEADRDIRMAWWRNARFGMFIHWGLYSIPAGEWPGKGSNHAEWIRDTAKIPVDEYERLLPKFNPVKFDAEQWVALAREAGMRYLVITSKHHDGFCLFDSTLTDWDVMSTPFKRDIMKELSDACKKDGHVRFCMYHSIMDWHHPDYLPRRPWEKTDRPEAGADFNRFVAYLKGQLEELCSDKYDPGLIWFDGQWEGTWNNTLGHEIEQHVRSLRPRIIINSRVGRAGGAYGLENTEHGGRMGDYGTPEQFIPDDAPAFDWETCMTMNANWGYNAKDHHFKTTKDLLQKLADIASKGGNFLLNVGPTAEGEIPAESVQRLQEIGAWMKTNGESIYGTQGGPFKILPWGRCTMKRQGPTTRLYLHVFDWPKNGVLVVPGIYNEAITAHLLATPGAKLPVRRDDDALHISLPNSATDAINSVVVLDVAGAPDIADPPTLAAPTSMFMGTMDVTATTTREGATVRYTLDGSDPKATSPEAKGPIAITGTTTLRARTFRGDRAVSPVSSRTFTLSTPRPAAQITRETRGLTAKLYKGEFKTCDELSGLKHVAMETKQAFTLDRPNEDLYAYTFAGYLDVPRDGVFVLTLASDDGSRLFLGNDLIVDNDGLHSLQEKSAEVALSAGLHPIAVEYFERTGGAELKVFWSGPGVPKQVIPNSALYQP
jgi:alpha-L-fucosidase